MLVYEDVFCCDLGTAIASGTKLIHSLHPIIFYLFIYLSIYLSPLSYSTYNYPHLQPPPHTAGTIEDGIKPYFSACILSALTNLHKHGLMHR